MLFVKAVDKIMEKIKTVRPDNKDMVNISVIRKMFVWIARQKVFFKFSQDDISVAWRYSDAHTYKTYAP